MDVSRERDRSPSSRGTRWLPAQASCVLRGHPVDRLSTPHANGRATHSGHCPRYALSDSSASTATQTSFHLSYHLLYERRPYQVTQRKRPRVFASELPTATTAGAAKAHGSCHHSARSGPDCLPLSPLRRSSRAAGEKGRLRANRQRGPGAYTRRSTGPEWRCARHHRDDPDRPHSVWMRAITCFNFAERASLPAGGRMCGMRRKAQQIERSAGVRANRYRHP